MNIAKKIDITTVKKAEIDALQNQLLSAQYLVDELNAVVSALTEKSSEFTAILNAAESDKDTALSNFDQIKVIQHSVQSLDKNLDTVNKQSKKANVKLTHMSGKVSHVLEQLVFSAEVVNKLNEQVQKQKALNPLVSNELVAVMGKAVTDANNAIALTLTAIKSSYAASGTGEDLVNLSAEEQAQVKSLYNLINGRDIDFKRETSVVTEADKLVGDTHYRLADVKDEEGRLLKALHATDNAQQNMENSKNGASMAEDKLKTTQKALTAKQKTLSDLQSKDKDKLTAREHDQIAKLKQDISNLQKEVQDQTAALRNARQNYVHERQAYSAAIKILDEVRESLKDKQDKLDASMQKLDVVTQYQEEPGLYHILKVAYDNAVTKYKAALKANNGVTKELDHAKAKLANATIDVESLQAGLAAAKAAALAA